MPLCRFLTVLLCLVPWPVLARPSALCDRAAAEAARETGVPLDVMLALTRTETGRAGAQGMEPWPWAVNQAGQGYWFDSAAEAEQFVEAQLQFGASNLDIGCFQLNHRWHGKGFASLQAMFDPVTNARYAADFLRQKYGETGDWVQAAGAYHSGTEAFADRYVARFQDILAGFGGWQMADATGAGVAIPRANTYPLLMAGGGMASQGSLMPRVEGLGSLFGRMP